MSSPVNPEYRLLALKRKVNDLLMSRRLSADPERTGIVELGDFGKKCDALADHCAESVTELHAVRGAEARTAARIAEELELAARIAARMEELPRTTARIHKQCELLEAPARTLQTALDVELLMEEDDLAFGLGALAEAERAHFDELLAFEGTIRSPAPRPVPLGALRRALRRAMLEHEEGPFHLAVTDAGRLEFGDQWFDAEGEPVEQEELPRSVNEPRETKQALDLFLASPDEALKDFLLVKAIDAGLLALLGPKLGTHAWVTAARALPRRPGKRAGVRPEAVQRDLPGWDPEEAARGADKLANKRAGPEWARLPKAPYCYHLFGGADDALTTDLLTLGPALKRMEKGETVEDIRPVALRVWRTLAGSL
ncbi:MAG: hypothetical protein AAGD14_00860 [Planctomycetota bacterium]